MKHLLAIALAGLTGCLCSCGGPYSPSAVRTLKTWDGAGRGDTLAVVARVDSGKTGGPHAGLEQEVQAVIGRQLRNKGWKIDPTGTRGLRLLCTASLKEGPDLGRNSNPYDGSINGKNVAWIHSVHASVVDTRDPRKKAQVLWEGESSSGTGFADFETRAPQLAKALVHDAFPTRNSSSLP